MVAWLSEVGESSVGMKGRSVVGGVPAIDLRRGDMQRRLAVAF